MLLNFNELFLKPEIHPFEAYSNPLKRYRYLKYSI